MDQPTSGSTAQQALLKSGLHHHHGVNHGQGKAVNEALLEHPSVFIGKIIFPDGPSLIFPYNPSARMFTIQS